jgi:penicillin-binding protein 1C
MPLHRRIWHRLALVAFVLTGMSLTVRLLPYLVPIRAEDLIQNDRAMTFRDRNGLFLGTLLTQNQERTMAVPLAAVSPHFRQAILAAEDADFYRHGPLDLPAIARATVQAVQARHVVSGASTITMQLARLLQPAPRTIPNKLREVWRSWQLSAGMPRTEILTAYINRLPMGGNIYGVEAAARLYFGTAAADLTLAQASLLAAIPNNPNSLNPYRYWDALKRRQIYVLDRMVAAGFVSAQQARRAAATAVSLQPPQQGIVAAPHFLFWMARQLPPDGLTDIATTLDRPLQAFVATQVQEVVRSLAARNVRQAAALVIDNATGEVLAYVGSPDYFAGQPLAQNDGVQALRQPGSTLKPFLYQLALERRAIRSNTVLPDVPTYYAIPGARLYRPMDYDESFRGPVRVRLALANSLNVPAVRVLERVSVEGFLQRLQQLGFQHLDRPATHYGLGLALGSGEVSLWELAQAYLTLARRGNPVPLQGVPAKAGAELNSYGQPETWALVANMLGDRHARSLSFGVDSVLNLPFPAAVKTGTSSHYRDNWTVGFTTDYTVATWVGNFDGSPMQDMSGVDGAAPLWHRIMLHLHEGNEPEALPPPTGLVQRPICALSGLRPTAACPTVVQEYIYPQDLRDYEHRFDTVYHLVDGQVQLQLPSEYDEWLAQQGRSLLTPHTLEILSPGEGETFLLEATADRSPRQYLEFKLATAADDPIEWWLNGKKVSSSKTVRWPLRLGEWALEARSGPERDLVTFQVGRSSQRSFRRGFSISGRSISQ